MIGARARAAAREQVGVRMSCGIAHNKLLAKLASGMHTPDDQTALPASEATDFIRPLPVQVLRGAGYKTCRDLQAAGIETVAHLRAVHGAGGAPHDAQELPRGQELAPARPGGPSSGAARGPAGPRGMPATRARGRARSEGHAAPRPCLASDPHSAPSERTPCANSVSWQ